VRRPAAGVVLLLSLAAAAAARPTHVVVIVADDLGYSDLGSFGGEIDTPQLDRLALGGVRFSRFYSTPRCSPSRAALLTGQWPHQAGVGHLSYDWGADAYRGAIHDDVPTLAERLRDAGYATYMVGKWHLTTEVAGAGGAPPSSWPLARGFDRFYGTLGGSGSYFEPPALYDGDQPVDAAAAARETGGSFYLTDELGERATAMLEDHLAASPQRPFFLYLSFTAAHWPLHAPARDVERYRGRYDVGWDQLRAARFERQRALGLLAPGAELPARDSRVEAWSDTADREWQARRMEVYAAMVTAMDRAAGRVVATLERHGALDDTLIVFLSDNGACGEEFRGLYLLAPLVVPVPERTADGREMRFGDRPAIEPGPADTFTSYGRSWAHLSNTPLRLYKHWTHEGGIAVPFFVHWPAGLADRAGAVVATPAHVVDVTPTVLAVAAASAASGAQSDSPAATLDLAGVSLHPLLRGERAAPRALYWEHEGNRAVLDGDHKLVSRWPRSWELYEVAADRSETRDLAAVEPERAAELAERWSQWAAGVGVEPWPVVVPQVRTALTSLATVAFVALTLRRRWRAARRAPRAEPTPKQAPRAPSAERPPPIEPR
jgi:arylsulfatase